MVRAFVVAALRHSGVDVVEAEDGVVALDLPQVIAEANRLGLFLWVCEAEL